MLYLGIKESSITFIFYLITNHWELKIIKDILLSILQSSTTLVFPITLFLIGFPLYLRYFSPEISCYFISIKMWCSTLNLYLLPILWYYNQLHVPNLYKLFQYELSEVATYSIPALFGISFELFHVHF